MVMGDSGIFSKANIASENTNLTQAKEIIELKILEYKTDILSKKEIATLENFKKYYENNSEIKISLFKGNDTLEPINEGEEATRAKVKVEKYQYTFVLDEKLKIIQTQSDAGLNIEDDKIQNAEKMYLYKEGNEYLENGGNLINNEKSIDYQKSTFEKKENYIEFSAGIIPDQNPICTKENPMDITGYDKIYAEIEIVEEYVESYYRNISIETRYEDGTNMNLNYCIAPFNGLATPELNKKIIISYDISKLSDLNNVYIGISINGYKIKIYSIYLEKYQKTIQNLYNYGNEEKSIGGQWINNQMIPENNMASLTKDEKNMTYTIGIVYEKNPLCSKENPINITDFDVLKAEVELISTTNYTYRNFALRVMDKQGTYFNNIWIQPYAGYKEILNKKRTIVVDVSNLSEKECYIGIDGNDYTIKIYRIWLEKFAN